MARRTQAERHEHTRSSLVETAYTLFSQQGFAETGTDQVVAAANVSRGALYYHFKTKRDLFAAVVEYAHARVLEQIEARTVGVVGANPWQAIVDGSLAFIRAAGDPALARVLFQDGPAVLGWLDWRKLDQDASYGSLVTGLTACHDSGQWPDGVTIATMASFLSGAMNDAAMRVASAEEPQAVLKEVEGGLTQIILACGR